MMIQIKSTFAQTKGLFIHSVTLLFFQALCFDCRGDPLYYKIFQFLGSFVTVLKTEMSYQDTRHESSSPHIIQI